jgi:hypothetical protein
MVVHHRIYARFWSSLPLETVEINMPAGYSSPASDVRASGEELFARLPRPCGMNFLLH